MRARAHMAQVLEGTGLYSLTGSTPVDWELDAYSAGFAPLEAAFDKLLAECNIVGTPGAGFGPSGEGYFRLTAFNTREKTLQAMERVKQWQI